MSSKRCSSSLKIIQSVVRHHMCKCRTRVVGRPWRCSWRTDLRPEHRGFSGSVESKQIHSNCQAEQVWLVCRNPFSRSQRSCNRLLRDRRSTAIRSSIVAHHCTIRTLVRVRNELRRRVETFACPEQEIRLQSCADTSLQVLAVSESTERPAVGLHDYCDSTSHQHSSVPRLVMRGLSDVFSDSSQLRVWRLMLSGTYLTAPTANDSFTLCAAMTWCCDHHRIHLLYHRIEAPARLRVCPCMVRRQRSTKESFLHIPLWLFSSGTTAKSGSICANAGGWIVRDVPNSECVCDMVSRVACASQCLRSWFLQCPGTERLVSGLSECRDGMLSVFHSRRLGVWTLSSLADFTSCVSRRCK